MNPLALAAPLFLLLEIAQLVLGERYLGIRRIREQAEPRELPMREGLAAGWSLGLLVYGLWMVSLLFHPVGRVQGLVLLVTTGLGYTLRAATGLPWTLVILTFEGAIRIGMLFSLLGATWHALSG